MPETVFGEDIFSKSANILFNQVFKEPEVQNLLEQLRKNHTPTYIHSISVARLMTEFVISDKANLDDIKQKQMIRYALLHDIGKLKVPNEILDKSGKLSADEWNIIKNHTVDGFNIYAKTFGPNDGIPILIHHLFQKNNYPDINTQISTLGKYGIILDDINDREVIRESILLATIDNIESRFPIIKGRQDGIRKYSDRTYDVSNLTNIVKSSFNTANKIRKVGEQEYFEEIIDFNTELLLKINNS